MSRSPLDSAWPGAFLLGLAGLGVLAVAVWLVSAFVLAMPSPVEDGLRAAGRIGADEHAWALNGDAAKGCAVGDAAVLGWDGEGTQRVGLRDATLDVDIGGEVFVVVRGAEGELRCRFDRIDEARAFVEVARWRENALRPRRIGPWGEPRP